MARQLSRKIPLAELHCHLGGAVTPAIMWSIAHAQGIKLPTRDYWEFRDTITVSPTRARSFDGYLQLFHWTELIQSSPIAVERAVYEVVGGAYRKNNVTTMELRFNPMKRNRGGEQDLDHIIAAASRGMDRASLEYPVKPGLIFCLDRAFPFELNEIIAEKAITWRDRGVVGIDIAGPESATFRVADYKRLFRRARQFGLGLTVHTGESGSVDEVARVVELLEPDRIGHGVKAAYDPRAMAMIRDRGIVLEICPTSNLNTRVVSGWDEFRWIFDTFRRNEVRFTINTDGPEMLKTYIRDEMATLGRLGILSVEDQEVAAATSLGGVVRAERLGRRGEPAAPGAARGRGARRGVTARRGSRGPSGLGRLRDPVRAAPVARRDVRLADHVGAEDLLEQGELRLARRRRRAGDPEDRAVALLEPDRPVAVDHRARQVALLVLDDRELADAVLERRVGRQPLAEAVLHLLGDQPAPGVEDLVDEGVAADHADRGEQTRGEPVVVRRERDLGVGRDVVQVARPADAVADGPAVDEPRRLERAELLEDAGPARAEARGELFGRGCAVAAELDEDVPAERRGPGRDRSGRADRPGKGAL